MEASIDAKKAVGAARKHFEAVFSGESIPPITLEEVWYDGVEKVWCVTFGLRRQRAASIINPLDVKEVVRYKVVRVTEDGAPISIRNRTMEEAAE